MADLPSGVLAMQALRRAGVDVLFTLSGGHIWPLYDGARQTGVRLVDTRHEQAAAFGAEGYGKLTRRPGVAALTAGPGVTNGVSAVANARFGGAPMLVLGGRAPQGRWGMGSLQEIDHPALMAPITKRATTVERPEDVATQVADAYRVAATPRRGPAFVDIPIDVLFSQAGDETVPEWREPDPQPVDSDALAVAASVLARAERPVVVGGSDVWLGGAEAALQELVETLGAPVLLNGQGRGCIPADHDLTIARARGKALKDADVVAVVGTPLDFRLGFGSFGAAQVVHVVDDPAQVAAHVDLAAGVSGDLEMALRLLAEAAGGPAGELAEARAAWVAQLRDLEAATRADDEALLEADGVPIHPARVYGELRRVLDRDAVVIGDGGDFVSYAGRYVDSYTPGCWLDPGPYGCLGTGMGYAAAARLARPAGQVCVLLGDGAAGFGLMDADTLVRHRLPVVMVVGNNGMWALEKYPMQAIYDGWDVAADLQPETPYDRVVEALGGAGETVGKAADLGPALRRAFDAGVPYLVNVLTDPAVAYPRSTILA